MWCHLSFILLLLQSFNCVEISTLKNEADEDIFETKNNTNSYQTQRITQPSAQTQNIERTLTTPPPGNSSTAQKGKSDFRPSPQLETYLEFNKIPVPPAFPEAKHFSAYNFAESPIQWPNIDVTTEQAWRTRVKFPTTSTTTAPTSKDRPYEFYSGDRSTGKSYNIPMKSDYYNKPAENLPSIDDWNKFVLNEKKKQLIQKNQFDFTAPVERPVYGTSGGESHKTGTDWGAIMKQAIFGGGAGSTTTGPQKSSFDGGEIGKPPVHGLQGNPWKKIVKFLTAVIPIGLLISALTPTVITVQNVNGTQSRSRAVDAKRNDNKLISSLNYLNSIGCEDRILCELVLSASTTENGEQHIENLLNTFTKEGRAVEKAEEMRRIFEAVKNQDCRPITCENLKDKT